MSAGPNLSADRGSRFGIGFFRLLLKLCGLRAALAFAWVVTWFYAHFDRAAFAAAAPYLKLRFPGDAASERRLKRHFHRLIRHLAKVLIVSYRIGGGKSLPLEERGSENIPVAGGLVVALAHYGCWQAVMEILNLKGGRRINVMARPDHNGNMDKFIALGGGEHDFNVISTEGFSGGLVEASAALNRGEVVIVMADRAVEGSAKLEAEYLKGTIELPLSPWMLAADNAVPVLPVLTDFAEKPLRAVIRYYPAIAVEAPSGRRVRSADLVSAAAEYARILEAAALESPYSLFRFGNEKN